MQNFRGSLCHYNLRVGNPRIVGCDTIKYVGYSESKYHLRISFAHPRVCRFAHVEWLPLSIEKPQAPFREICVMFMFVPVR